MKLPNALSHLIYSNSVRFLRPAPTNSLDWRKTSVSIAEFLCCRIRLNLIESRSIMVLAPFGKRANKNDKPMNQPFPDYTPQDLLAFYDRVKPILSEWLAKPVWTARETAMLCAGYVPSECDASAASYQPESIQSSAPLDPHGYMPPDCDQCTIYLMLLDSKACAPPRDMVHLLRPSNRKSRLMEGSDGRHRLLEIPRGFGLDRLRELQWFFIIGNAVGLQVPALVPFSLLDKLSDRLTVQHVDDSVTGQNQDQPEATVARIGIEEGEQPVIAGQSSEAKPKATQRKLRERQPLQMTPERRGYHTTEEVAGLTDLLSDTLNKYAREGRSVEGFTPFKRQNGRYWQWRDEQRQAEYEATLPAEKLKRRLK